MHITYLIQFHIMPLLLNHQANCTIVNVALHDSLHFTKKEKKGGKKPLVLFLHHRRGDEVWREGGAKFKGWSFRCFMGLFNGFSLNRKIYLNKTP